MLALAFLLGQAGYTLVYSAATGDCWQNPWCHVARAFGKSCSCSGEPSGAEEIAAGLLGIEAWKVLLGTGKSLAGGALSTAEKAGAGAAAGAAGKSVLSKAADAVKNILSRVASAVEEAG